MRVCFPRSGRHRKQCRPICRVYCYRWQGNPPSLLERCDCCLHFCRAAAPAAQERSHRSPQHADRLVYGPAQIERWVSGRSLMQQWSWDVAPGGR
jgi:hypothetical protein